MGEPGLGDDADEGLLAHRREWLRGAARGVPAGRLGVGWRDRPPRQRVGERNARWRSPVCGQAALPDDARRARLGAARGGERAFAHERRRHGRDLLRVPRSLHALLPAGIRSRRRPLRGGVERSRHGHTRRAHGTDGASRPDDSWRLGCALAARLRGVGRGVALPCRRGTAISPRPPPPCSGPASLPRRPRPGCARDSTRPTTCSSPPASSSPPPSPCSLLSSGPGSFRPCCGRSRTSTTRSAAERPDPDAIHDFIAYAYHEWQEPFAALRRPARRFDLRPQGLPADARGRPGALPAREDELPVDGLRSQLRSRQRRGPASGPGGGSSPRRHRGRGPPAGGEGGGLRKRRTHPGGQGRPRG